MSHNFNQLDEMLLDEFNKAGLIESSTIKLYKSKKKLDETVALNENKSSAISPDEFEIRGVVVNGEQFARIYQDYETYPSIDAMMTAVGLPPALFSDISYDSFKRQFRRLRSHFRENKRYGYIFDVDADDRKKYYYEARDSVPTASRDGIDPGKKNRKTNTTKVANMLNGKEVVPGEFYTDISRIPKRKWGSWIKFWERQVARIKNPTSILGRVWRKVFIMGYEFSRGVVVEIWYNSATSDFSVYDQNGAELGRPAKSMQEAVRLFVTFLLSEYKSDENVFRGNMNDLAKSYLGAVTRGANMDAIEAERESRLAAQEMKSKNDPLGSVSRITSAQKERNQQKHAEQDQNRKNWNDAARGSFKSAFKKAKGAADDWVAKGAADDFMKQQQKNREEFNQRQKKEYEQRTGSTYDEDDVSYAGQDRNGSPPKKATVPGLPALSYQEVRKKSPMGEAELNAVWREYQEIYAKIKEAQERAENLKKKKEQSANDGQYGPEYEKSRQYIENMKKAAEDLRKAMYKGGKKKGNGDTSTFDSAEEIHEDGAYDLLENEDTDRVLDIISTNMASEEMDREAQARRKMAQQSGFTTTSIKTSAVGEMLSMYDQTKVNPKHSGVLGRFLMNNTFKPFRGRKAKIQLPTKKANLFDRLQMSIIGTTYRADFVIGFSLKDAINIEIWYVTEPDPSKGSWDATSSSFYVYDITAAKIIRANLPYYRNALSVAMAKIAVNDEDVAFSNDPKPKKGQTAEELAGWKRYHDSRRGQ